MKAQYWKYIDTVHQLAWDFSSFYLIDAVTKLTLWLHSRSNYYGNGKR